MWRSIGKVLIYLVLFTSITYNLVIRLEGPKLKSKNSIPYIILFIDKTESHAAACTYMYAVLKTS